MQTPPLGRCVLIEHPLRQSNLISLEGDRKNQRIRISLAQVDDSDGRQCIRKNSATVTKRITTSRYDGYNIAAMTSIHTSSSSSSTYIVLLKKMIAQVRQPY